MVDRAPLLSFQKEKKYHVRSDGLLFDGEESPDGFQRLEGGDGPRVLGASGDNLGRVGRLRKQGKMVREYGSGLQF